MNYQIQVNDITDVLGHHPWCIPLSYGLMMVQVIDAIRSNFILIKPFKTSTHRDLKTHLPSNRKLLVAQLLNHLASSLVNLGNPCYFLSTCSNLEERRL